MKEQLTKGEKKIMLQFERFTETDVFKNEVKRIRKLVKLPVNGITPTEEDLKDLSNPFRVPENLPIKKPADGRHPLRVLNIETQNLLNLLPVDNRYLSLLIKYYIIYNKFFYSELEHQEQYLHTSNVCELEDAQREFNEYSPDEGVENLYASGMYHTQAYVEMMKNKIWKYPVVLNIHPDASQRDIIEYVKAHWIEIAYYQKLYSDRTKSASFKNSKTKVNKNTKARNELIFKNRNLPSKEISRLLADRGIYLDVGHILKIISLEKKKREKK